MEISVTEVAKARETVAALLEQLQFDAYLFDVEPRQGDWAVHVECAIDDGWEDLTLSITRQELSRTREDDGVRAAVLKQWGDRLAFCRRRR